MNTGTGVSPTSRRTVTISSPGSSPRNGAASAPVDHESVDVSYHFATQSLVRPLSFRGPLLAGQLPSSLPNSPVASRSVVLGGGIRPPSPSTPLRRRRAHSLGVPPMKSNSISGLVGGGASKFLNDFDRARARDAQRVNDSMVYLDGAQIYSCAQCRTHLTSHDDIISKSFHGRHGRAYLFDQCVNVTIGPSEDRLLITGLHSVADMFCKRCRNLVGWTYLKAYESSQKYKEGKFIIEKINLHLEESDYYDAAPPAGEKTDRWRKRSMSWGSCDSSSCCNVVYEYQPPSGGGDT